MRDKVYCRVLFLFFIYLFIFYSPQGPFMKFLFNHRGAGFIISQEPSVLFYQTFMKHLNGLETYTKVAHEFSNLSIDSKLVFPMNFDNKYIYITRE